MRIDGNSVPISIDAYIWLVRKAYSIHIVKNKYVNDSASPYDVLGYYLCCTLMEDMMYSRYIRLHGVKEHGDTLLGTLDMRTMIDSHSFVNGKVLGGLHYTRNKRLYNVEILSMIHKAIDILLLNIDLFEDEKIKRDVQALSENELFTRYSNDVDIDMLEKKNVATDLCNIIAVCKLIFNTTLNRKETESKKRNIDNCLAISIRHLIEHALRKEMKRLANGKKLSDDKKISIVRHVFYGGETTNGDKTDITVLGNKIFVIEVKTGVLTSDNRSNWDDQTRGYMNILSREYNINANNVTGTVLYLNGQKRDKKKEYNVTEFESIDDLLKTGSYGLAMVAIDLNTSNIAFIEEQIKHLAKLIVEYNYI